MYMYIYIYMYMYIPIYMYMYIIEQHVYIHIVIHIHVHTYIHNYLYIYMYMYIPIYFNLLFIQSHTHTHINTYIHISIHVYPLIHTQIGPRKQRNATDKHFPLNQTMWMPTSTWLIYADYKKDGKKRWVTISWHHLNVPMILYYIITLELCTRKLVTGRSVIITTWTR